MNSVGCSLEHIANLCVSRVRGKAFRVSEETSNSGTGFYPAADKRFWMLCQKHVWVAIVPGALRLPHPGAALSMEGTTSTVIAAPRADAVCAESAALARSSCTATGHCPHCRRSVAEWGEVEDRCGGGGWLLQHLCFILEHASVKFNL